MLCTDESGGGGGGGGVCTELEAPTSTQTAD